MRLNRYSIVALLIVCAAVALPAWSNRPVPLTEEQKAWIARTERGIVEPLPQSDAEWKVVLSREQYQILRNHGTERPFNNKYWDENSQGLYRCAGCGQGVFSAVDKYESGSGWPSFTRPADHNRVTTAEDRGWFSNRTEVRCGRCDGHLGHVFDDGPSPLNLRYCINSAALHLDSTQQPSSPNEE